MNVDLSAQVEAFLNDSGGVTPSDALYVIEMGGNDVRDALAAFARGAMAESSFKRRSRPSPEP